MLFIAWQEMGRHIGASVSSAGIVRLADIQRRRRICLRAQTLVWIFDRFFIVDVYPYYVLKKL